MAAPALDRFLTCRLHRIAKIGDRVSAAAHQAECGLGLSDGRGVALLLTREGRVLWRRVMKLIERRNAEVFGCLRAAERQALDRLLDRLVAHLDGAPAD
jgi:hypothetical protein